MSGDGVTGLGPIRDRLGRVEATVERLDERSQSQGRELERQGRVLDRVDRAVGHSYGERSERKVGRERTGIFIAVAAVLLSAGLFVLAVVGAVNGL